MEQMNTPAPAPVRSGTLTALCIVTFIWSAIEILGILFLAVAGASLMGNMFGNLGGGIIIVALLVVLIFVLLKLWGAIKMFNLKKSGYVMYMIPSVLYVVLGLIGLVTAPIVWYNIVILLVAIIFIVMYGQEMKKIK